MSPANIADGQEGSMPKITAQMQASQHHYRNDVHISDTRLYILISVCFFQLSLRRGWDSNPRGRSPLE